MCRIFIIVTLFASIILEIESSQPLKKLHLCSVIHGDERQDSWTVDTDLCIYTNNQVETGTVINRMATLVSSPVCVNDVSCSGFYLDFSKESFPDELNAIYNKIIPKLSIFVQDGKADKDLFLVCGLISNISMYYFEYNKQLNDTNNKLTIKEILDSITSTLQFKKYWINRYRREDID